MLFKRTRPRAHEVKVTYRVEHDRSDIIGAGEAVRLHRWDEVTVVFKTVFTAYHVEVPQVREELRLMTLQALDQALDRIQVTQ